MNRCELFQAIVEGRLLVLHLPFQIARKAPPAADYRRPHNMARLAAECAKLDPAEEVVMAEGIFPPY